MREKTVRQWPRDEWTNRQLVVVGLGSLVVVGLIALFIIAFDRLDAVWPLIWIGSAVVVAFVGEHRGYPWLLGLAAGLVLGPIGILIAVPLLPNRDAWDRWRKS